MDLIYRSTRNEAACFTASQAILKGLADDGGLFVPERIPALTKSMDELAKMSYQETAYEVMKQFLTDFTEEELKDCISRAYDEKFDTKEIAPIREADGAYYLELFHGATIAFKDMALSILPHLLITSARKNQVKNEIVILTATSGDTGKAALAGFADVPGTRIVVFYPKNGVSPIQEKQMVTQKGANTFVVGIRGNFDDAQTGVKKMFGDKALAEEMAQAGFQFSSANSINIGRLVPQVVYYVYAYAKLYGAGKLAKDERLNVVVPTGNFGNILAAYYAKLMGVPIGKLICASNDNKVLYDFFRTGTYDRNREFILTTSPSMDILISSNLERMLFELSGRDDRLVREYMSQLAEYGSYRVDSAIRTKLKKLFSAGYCDDQQTQAMIARMWNEKNYLIDPHTAVAFHVLEEYREETGDDTVTIAVSTASPFKFCGSVLDALGVKEHKTGLEILDQLTEVTGVPTPAPLARLKKRRRRFDNVVDKAAMKSCVLDFLK